MTTPVAGTATDTLTAMDANHLGQAPHQALIAATPSLMAITVRPELVFVRGEGSYLWDAQGKRYLDWIQGWAVNCLGHAPKQISDALTQQGQLLISPSPAFYNAPSIALAEFLTTHSCMDQVFFASSGAEANEGAFKLARKWGRVNKGGAYEIITFINGFHGRTIAAMSASGKPGWDTIYAPQVPGFPKAKLNDLDSVRALITDKTVGIMLEPVQGEGGVIPATPEFMQGLRALCDEHKLLLICDEVQTGCGRMGSLFAYEQTGVEPDIMTLGKGIGGGVPLAALLAKNHVCVFQPGDQGGTYCGNPLMAAVGLAVVQTLAADGFLQQVQTVGAAFKAALQNLSAELGLGEVRGYGLLLALELGCDQANQVVDVARDRGLLINAPRAHCLRFMPALNMTEAELAEGMAQLKQILVDVLKG